MAAIAPKQSFTHSKHFKKSNRKDFDDYIPKDDVSVIVRSLGLGKTALGKMMCDEHYGNHNIILDVPKLGICGTYAVDAKDLKKTLVKYSYRGWLNATAKQIAKLIKDMENTATDKWVSVCYIRPDMFALVFGITRKYIEECIGERKERKSRISKIEDCLDWFEED